MLNSQRKTVVVVTLVAVLGLTVGMGAAYYVYSDDFQSKEADLQNSSNNAIAAAEEEVDRLQQSLDELRAIPTPTPAPQATSAISPVVVPNIVRHPLPTSGEVKRFVEFELPEKYGVTVSEGREGGYVALFTVGSYNASLGKNVYEVNAYVPTRVRVIAIEANPSTLEDIHREYSDTKPQGVEGVDYTTEDTRVAGVQAKQYTEVGGIFETVRTQFLVDGYWIEVSRAKMSSAEAAERILDTLIVE
jgi:hypothetical protein